MLLKREGGRILMKQLAAEQLRSATREILRPAGKARGFRMTVTCVAGWKMRGFLG